MALTKDIVNKSVGDIVLENPNAASVFSHYGIDFCCGGNKSLAEALQATDISIEDIVDEIEKAEIADEDNHAKHRDIKEKSLTELVDYIEKTHHTYLKRYLPEIAQYLKNVRNAHGENHGELYEIYDNFIKLKEELTDHLKKEEDHVFPLIWQLEKDKKSLDNAKAALILKEIEDEHEGAGDLLKANKKLSNSYEIPSDACNSYTYVYKLLADLEADTFEHIHLENNLLHPRVRSKLA